MWNLPDMFTLNLSFFSEDAEGSTRNLVLSSEDRKQLGNEGGNVLSIGSYISGPLCML